MNGNQKEPSQTGSFDFFHDRAMDAFSKGKLPEAERLCLNARALQPDHVGVLNLLGQVYLGQQRPTDAVNVFSRAVALGVPRPNLYFNLALAQQAAGLVNEAIESVRSAIALDPAVPLLHAKLGQLLLLANSTQEAITALRHALQLDPKSVPVRLNLAQALTDMGEANSAETVTREALSLNPKDATAHRMLGRIYQQNGQFIEAAKSFQTAIQIQPNAVAAYFALAYSKKLTSEDVGLIQRMKNLAKMPQLTETDRSLIHYALGKAFDDSGEFVPAAKHFELANRSALSARGTQFDTMLEAAQIEKIIELFPAQVFSRWPGGGSSSKRPIFIVGMIRSGTTLVEQILSRHPDVFAGGELRYWTDNEPRMLLEMVESENPDFAAWVSGYEAELDRISKSSPHVTDKMPLNYWAVGLIHLAYPNAKIIHCRRNPLDNCLSVYVTPFRHAPSFGHDVVNIATGYRQYLHLMDHWRSVLPPATMIDMYYEELVANPETNIRKMVEFCGLEWDEACLDSAANKQGVNTPSQWQVRQPLYRRSVNRWENYKDLLMPILDTF